MPELSGTTLNGSQIADHADVVDLMQRHPKINFATASIIVAMRSNPTVGWSDNDVLTLRASMERRYEADDDTVPEVVGDTTKLGDVWRLGRHRLVCGDSTDSVVVARLMDDKKATLVVTDPPYGINFLRGQFILDPRRKFTDKILSIAGDTKKGQDQADFVQQVFEVARDFCTPGASVYMFSESTREGCYSMLGLCDAGVYVQSQLIWAKGHMVLGQADYQWKHEVIWYGWFDGAPHRWFGGRKNTTVLECRRIDATYHPNEKPVELVELVELMIKNSSLPGEVVYEPFGGSGTAWIAAEKTDRVCCGVELDPHLCDVIKLRWEKYTGQKAVLGA